MLQSIYNRQFQKHNNQSLDIIPRVVGGVILLLMITVVLYVHASYSYMRTKLANRNVKLTIWSHKILSFYVLSTLMIALLESIDFFYGWVNAFDLVTLKNHNPFMRLVDKRRLIDKRPATKSRLSPC